MGQATSAHQEVLRPLTQCGEDTNLGRHLRVRGAGDPAQAAEARSFPLHDFANSEPLSIRENAAFTGFSADRRHIRVGSVLQPTRSIQLMTGQ